MPTRQSAARDPAKPASHFSKVAGLYRQQITAAMTLNSHAVLGHIADTHVRAARALYSAGAPVAECLVQLAGAASFFTQDMAASRTHPHPGLPNIEFFIESLGAACLCDDIVSCTQAFRTANIQNVPAWQQSVLALVVTVFEGKTTLPQGFDLQGAPSEWAPLFTDMFLVVMRKDHAAFPEALEAYFRERWGPSADRVARRDIAAKPSPYVGKWAFHSAALCKLMGGVPPLSKKVLQYVPAELACPTIAPPST